MQKAHPRQIHTLRSHEIVVKSCQQSTSVHNHTSHRSWLITAIKTTEGSSINSAWACAMATRSFAGQAARSPALHPSPHSWWSAMYSMRVLNGRKRCSQLQALQHFPLLCLFLYSIRTRDTLCNSALNIRALYPLILTTGKRNVVFLGGFFTHLSSIWRH